MIDYLFVLGKNLELSLAELNAYFETNDYNQKLIEKTQNFVVFRFERVLDNIIDHLGGTIKIVKVEKMIPVSKSIEGELGNLIQKNIEAKYFGISLYPESEVHNSHFNLAKKLSMYVKKKTGLKFLPYPRNRKFPELTHVEVIKKRLIEDSFEIVIGIGKKKYLGKTTQIHNPFEFKKRDVDRPKQRPMFSISPRLSKIMINLSQCKPGQNLLDPFCGFGTIIQEALLEKIDAKGIDIDEMVVNSARDNLKWLNDEYDLKLREVDKKIIRGDARKLSDYFPEESFNTIVTEPYLGPPLSKHVHLKEAEQIIDDLKSLFQEIFEELSKIVKSNGKIIIIIPSIRTKIKNVKMNTDFIKRCGFFVENSFMDFDNRHRTLREIYVIKKN